MEEVVKETKEEVLSRLTANPEKFAATLNAVLQKTENVKRLDSAFNKYRGKMLTILEASGLTPDSLVAMKKLFKNDTGELWNSVAKIVTDLEVKNSPNGTGKE